MSDGSRALPRGGARGAEPKAFQLVGMALVAIFMILIGYLCDMNGHLCDMVEHLCMILIMVGSYLSPHVSSPPSCNTEACTTPV